MIDENLLNSDKIETLYSESNELYDQGRYSDSVKLLLEIWKLLPEPKNKWEFSYHVVEAISETFLIMNKFAEARKWANELPQYMKNRFDSGEYEFLMGKIYFNEQNMDLAKEYFLIAHKKSEGRCFEGEPDKYHDLIC